MPRLTSSLLTEKHLQQFEDDGYFILRSVISRDVALEVRGAIRNHIMSPLNEATGDHYDPMDPMGNSPDARAARFRKLGDFCVNSPLVWAEIHCSEAVLRVAQQFLGDDILLKYNSCFLKPALTGSETPWHQDNGLWRDFEIDPFNFWMAIDTANKQNACMQFIPGSHREPIVEHVMYSETDIHGQLPREVVEQTKAKYGGVVHIELEPGDTAFWHSNLFHYSPVNRSSESRIGVAGVYTTPQIVEQTGITRQLQWCMKGGEVLQDFPPAVFDYQGQPHAPAPVSMLT